MGEESAAIREEIEQTRHSMEDTVDAISYKTDVKSRLQENVEEKKSAMTDAIDNVKRTISGKASSASDRSPDASDVKATGRQAKAKAKRGVRMAESNPLGLGLGALAAGFLAGLIAPSTRLEDEQIGELADNVKEHIVETGQEALERGKEVAQESAHAAVEAAKETAQEQGQEQGQELADSAKQHTESAKGDAKEHAQSM